MEMIRNLQISNYKSIKLLNLTCNRINVLIGEPNVGKSNILEALDLSYMPSMFFQNEAFKLSAKEDNSAVKQEINIKKYFRVNEPSDLFYLGDISKTISVIHPGFSFKTELKFVNPKNNLLSGEEEKSFFECTADGGNSTRFDNNFIPIPPLSFSRSPVYPFRFIENIDFHDNGNYMNNLIPPFGNNISKVIQYHPEFRTLIGELIEDFNLELSIDVRNGSSQDLYWLRKINKGVVYRLKYEALADTLRRLIFHVAAIRYNNGAVITLEEPDAHSFPKYVSFLGDEIIQNQHNQFFIATHSPYLLNNLIENTPQGEVGIFVCGFDKEKGTTAYKLSNDELSELLNYGIDIFFNINRYAHDRESHSA